MRKNDKNAYLLDLIASEIRLTDDAFGKIGLWNDLAIGFPINDSPSKIPNSSLNQTLTLILILTLIMLKL